MNDSTLKKFYAKISQTNTCWIWVGAQTPGGYGKMGVGGKTKYAHRLSYEHWNGPIPHKLQIDHLCRVRQCVNPQHLEAVSGRENLIRGFGASGVNARKTICNNGHAYTPENTYLYRGRRQCNECRAAYRKIWNDKQRKARKAALTS